MHAVFFGHFVLYFLTFEFADYNMRIFFEIADNTQIYTIITII